MAKIEESAPSGARFLTASERHGYAGRPAIIQTVKFDPANKFGARWLIELTYLDSGEIVQTGMGDNPYRSRMFGNIAALIEQGTAIDPVVLFADESAASKGHSAPWAFRSATDDEIAAAGEAAAAE